MSVESPAKTPVGGKQRLIDAALRLAARGSSLTSLGLRELAREAGLNHNTFYRHYDSLEALGREMAQQIAAEVMAGMKRVRQQAQKHGDATRGAAEYFLDFVQERPQVFIVGLRELHSMASPMRGILQRVLESVADESVEQIISMDLAPGIDHAVLRPVTLSITHFMFAQSLEYLEHPERREAIVERMVDFIRRQFFGAAALQQLGGKIPQLMRGS